MQKHKCRRNNSDLWTTQEMQLPPKAWLLSQAETCWTVISTRARPKGVPQFASEYSSLPLEQTELFIGGLGAPASQSTCVTRKDNCAFRVKENSLHTRRANGYTVTKVDRLQVTTDSLSLPQDLQTPFLVHVKPFTLQPLRKINYGHDLALRPTRLSGLGLWWLTSRSTWWFPKSGAGSSKASYIRKSSVSQARVIENFPQEISPLAQFPQHLTFICLVVEITGL